MILQEKQFEIQNEEQMRELGRGIGALLTAGNVVCLTGDLGAGKTTLTKSIAEGLGIDEYVTSPSYTIVNEYMGRLPLYHFDVYRINEVEEMYELGYEEYFFSEGVCVIEWAGMVEELLPEERIWIEIYQGETFDKRKLIIKAKAEVLQKLEALI